MSKFLTLIISFCFISMPFNAALAQGANNPPETVEDVSGNPTNLTDQQMFDAQNFNHTGKKDRLIQENCKKYEGQDKGMIWDSKAALESCDLSKIESDGLWGVLEQHMGKAYVMIFGGMSIVGGGGLPTTTVGNTVVDGKTVDNKVTDVCMITAMGWEMVAMLMQNQLNQNTEQATSTIKDEQVRALVAVKKAHEDRALTAKIQSGVYGVVSLCYVGYGIAGGVYGNFDPMILAKGGAAVLLTGLYLNKATKHDAAARAVQLIIDSLPPTGDCNPYTDTGCFCKEESSQQLFANEYQQVCVRKLPLNAPPESLGCGVQVNNQISFDKECKCKQTNSCFNPQIKTFDPKFKIANNVIGLANQGSDLLGSSEFQPAKLSSFSTDASAFASKTLKTMKRKTLNPKLNQNQIAAATELARVLPPDIAATIATNPNGNSPVGLGSGGGPSGNLSNKLSPDIKKKLADAIKVNYSSGGSGFEKNSDSGSEPQFQLPSFGKKSDAGNSEVVTFAEKAINNADVNNSKETPIFDIISNRYRRSGWNRVESAEMKEAPAQQ
jgi:hypothetical protein